MDERESMGRQRNSNWSFDVKILAVFKDNIIGLTASEINLSNVFDQSHQDQRMRIGGLFENKARWLLIESQIESFNEADIVAIGYIIGQIELVIIVVKPLNAMQAFSETYSNGGSQNPTLESNGLLHVL